MIDRFTTTRFTEALDNIVTPENWNSGGMQQGEEIYYVTAGDFARVVVRSSIDSSGVAADSGENSIRLWLEVFAENEDYRPVKKLDTHTTRVAGWETRMQGKINQLRSMGEKVKRMIPMSNGKPQPFWFVKSGKNMGRPCSKDIKNNTGFTWMDEPLQSVWEDTGDKSESSGMFSGAQTSSETEEVEEEMKAKSLSDFLQQAKGEAKEKAQEIADELAIVRTPSEQQLAAIYAPTDVPIRCIADAGSGKTFVLEHRVTHLLQEGFKPEDIVVVTFTRDMSKDMANRIISRNPEFAGTAGEQQICSIHAFCNRMLAGEGWARRIPDKPWEQKRMLQDIAKNLWPYTQESDPSTCRPSWEELLRVFGNAKNRFMGPDTDFIWYEEMWGGYHAERLAKARREFDQAMYSNGWWSFIDMLYDMEHALVTKPNFKAKMQGKFKYLMIDEGQDTNGQAMRILTTVAEPENQIFIVGDPDQLLFRFTGATPDKNLQEGFTERYPDGLTFFLETNYRSTQTIVNASKRLIAHNYKSGGGPYDDELRKNSHARPDAEEGVSITFDEYKDADEEARILAEDIATRLQNGENPNTIFIASRTRAQLAYLEPPLTKWGVPFINITGGSFWNLRHVNIVLSYMRLAMDGEDGDSFRRIYNVASNNMQDRYGEYCPTRWLGNSFLREVDRTYDPEIIRQASFKYSGWQAGIDDLIWTMDNVKHLVDQANDPLLPDANPGAVVRWIMENSLLKYLKYEEGLEDGEQIGKLADLEAVVDIARRFDTVEAFFEKVDKALQAAKDAKSKDWNKYVVLSTVHRLKGMERPTVYGIGWCEGEKETPDGNMPVGVLPHTYSLSPPPSKGVLSMNGMSRLEDERCIAYVLVTRAQEQVLLSGYRKHMSSPMWPSRFVNDINAASSTIQRNITE